MKHIMYILSFFILLSNATSWACNSSHVLGQGGSGAVYTMSAETMKKGDIYIGINSEHVRNDKVSDASILKAVANGDDHIHSIDSVNTSSLSFSYGISDDLTLSMQLPYLEKNNIRAGEYNGIPEVHPHGDSKGLGDIPLLFQYKFYDEDKLKIALIVGIKIPTGNTNVSYDGNVLEADLLPGSGSWDYFSGLAWTKYFSKFSLHSNILYQYTTKGVDESKLGNIFSYNFAFSYSLIESSQEHFDLLHEEGHDHSNKYGLDFFVELNGASSKSDSFTGKVSNNTGSNVILLNTGLQLKTDDGYATFFAIGKPVYEVYKGIQSEIKYKVTFGIGKQF